MNPKVEATALIKSKLGKANVLKAALLDLIEETLKEPGCELFKIFQHDADPEALTLWEIFSSQAALTAHLQQSYTQKFFALELTESISVTHHRAVER